MTSFKKIFINNLKPQTIRTMKEFALSEFMIPTGPYAGTNFSFAVSPWNESLLDAFDDPHWGEYWVQASVQSGKTMLLLQLPALYHLFEVGEPVILGAPSIEIASSIYQERILPAIEASQYKDLLPLKGAGSRKGKATAITFRNGATLRFMGASGGDGQRSSYTARVILITEVSKMDDLRSSSDETDPVSQIIARSTAFGSNALVYCESTVTDLYGRIHQEVAFKGSNTKIELRCPHCKKYANIERKGLIGFEDAENEVEARKEARYACQKCGAVWNKSDRKKALDKYKFVHGNKKEETRKFGLSWSAFHSGLLTMEDISAKEWNAKQLETESAMREINQFVWSIPYLESDIDQTEVTMAGLLEHIDLHHALTEVPKNIETIIGSIDVQKNWLYFSVYGYDNTGSAWLIDYGVIDIVPEEMQGKVSATPQMLETGLEEVYDKISEYNINAIMLDGSYKHESSDQPLVRRWGMSKSDVHTFIGRGSGQMERMSGKKLYSPTAVSSFVDIRREKGGERLYFTDVDRIKDEILNRLLRERGEPGYIYLFKEAAQKEHTWLRRHLTSERKRIIKRGGKQVREWIKQRKRNDQFDCAYMCLTGFLLFIAGAFKKTKKSIRAPKDFEEPKPVKVSKKAKIIESDAVSDSDSDKPKKRRNKASMMDF